MSFFDKVKTKATVLTTAVSKAGASAIGSSVVAAKENTQIALLQNELNSIEAQLDLMYVKIGKKYCRIYCCYGP